MTVWMNRNNKFIVVTFGILSTGIYRAWNTKKPISNESNYGVKHRHACVLHALTNSYVSVPKCLFPLGLSVWLLLLAARVKSPAVGHCEEQANAWVDHLSLNQGQRLCPWGYLADNPEQTRPAFQTGKTIWNKYYSQWIIYQFSWAPLESFLRKP